MRELTRAYDTLIRHVGRTMAENQRTAQSAKEEPTKSSAPVSMAEADYAGFWTRVVASIIDYLAVGTAVYIVSIIWGFAIGLSGGSEFHAAFMGFMLSIVINWFYYSMLESSVRRATLGKMALGLVVADLFGNRISFGRATGRYFCERYLRSGSMHRLTHGCFLGEEAGPSRQAGGHLGAENKIEGSEAFGCCFGGRSVERLTRGLYSFEFQEMGSEAFDLGSLFRSDRHFDFVQYVKALRKLNQGSILSL